MAGQANDKIQMSNKIQIPNANIFIHLFKGLSHRVNLEFGRWHLKFKFNIFYWRPPFGGK
jgi:hypothetical protein